MKIRVKKDKLQKVITLTKQLVTRHATIPILEKAFIKAINGENYIVVKGSDVEQYGTFKIPANVEEGGTATIDPTKLLKLLKLEDEGDVVMTKKEDEDKVKVSIGNNHFKLISLPPEEYIAFPKEGETEVKININVEDFLFGITRVGFTISKKSFTPQATSLYMKLEENDNGKQNLVFVGTDTFRLAEQKIEINDDEQIDVRLFKRGDDNNGILLPKPAINKIEKILKASSDNSTAKINMTLVDKKIIKVQGVLKGEENEKDIEFIFHTILVEGTFPDYKQIEGFDGNMVIESGSTVKINELEKQIKKSSILGDISKLKTKDNKIEIIAGIGEDEDGKMSILGESQVGKIDLAINNKYISEFISAINKTSNNVEYIRLKHGGAGSILLLEALSSDENDNVESYLYGVNPYNLNE